MKICFPLLLCISFAGQLSAQTTDSVKNLRLYKLTLDTPKTANASVTSRPGTDLNSYVIVLKENALSASYKQVALPINNLRELDKYISQHQRQIRTSPLIIKGNSQLKYEYFQQLVAVLKKYDILKFKLETTE